ncbi:MAG: 3-deoxy-manno-octulosonate cytidylyltransferase [Pseudomonadales bacterium]|nr:3-deoxy-manno-octulosonate cytidylyltransferase [Pseudomonadales bacterium]
MNHAPFTVIIPARFASSRLPGKPLLDIAGKPMIQHVYQQACLSAATEVIIATDHAAIFQAAEDFGAKVVMTSESHESGTDRLQEVVATLQLADDAVVVNVQGDEPLVPPSVINQTAALLTQTDASSQSMATLFEFCESSEQVFDPNVVKVVTTEPKLSDDMTLSQALYFSRAPMPWHRDSFEPATLAASLPSDIRYKRHLGIYAYRVGLLHRFVSWPVAALEQVEKLEQLRVLANGEAINIALACESLPPGVDTQADLDKVRALFAKPA